MPSTSVPDNNQEQEIKPERKMVALDLSKEEKCRFYLEQSNRIARSLKILATIEDQHESTHKKLISSRDPSISGSDSRVVLNLENWKTTLNDMRTLQFQLLQNLKNMKHELQKNDDLPIWFWNKFSLLETLCDENEIIHYPHKPLPPGNRFPFPPGHNLDWQTSKCLPLCIKCDVKNKAHEFIASYFTDRKERKDSGTFEELFPNGYPKDSILDRRSRPLNCPDCVKRQEEYKDGRKKFFAEQLSKYVTKQMVCRDINNISNIKYPPKTINRLIVEYVKENINFDWVSRCEANLQYLNARKAHYDKSDKLDKTDLAQCFAVLIENMDVTVLQDSKVNLVWRTSKCLPLCIKCNVKNKAYEFIASYFTDRKERKDSGTFEELFPNGYPKNSILDRRSRPFNCPGCVEHQKEYKEGRKKFFAEQLTEYVTKQMVCRDINNVTNIKYPPKTINRLIIEYVKENINFDWVSRCEANLQYLNARKAHYDKSDKLDQADLAQCFAVLIENMDVTVLQDSNVLRLQQNTPNYAIWEQEWLRSVFPGLQLS